MLGSRAYPPSSQTRERTSHGHSQLPRTTRSSGQHACPATFARLRCRLAPKQMAGGRRIVFRWVHFRNGFSPLYSLQQDSVSSCAGISLPLASKNRLAPRWADALPKLEDHAVIWYCSRAFARSFATSCKPTAIGSHHRQTARPEDFRALTGNLKLTLIFPALTWTLAAFGEEMVYRGYLMNRVADLFNRTQRAWIISLIAVHVGFGIAHTYQGLTGVIDEGLSGLLLGLIYLRPYVAAHGLHNISLSTGRDVIEVNAGFRGKGRVN
jgi:hypothetical protein